MTKKSFYEADPPKEQLSVKRFILAVDVVLFQLIDHELNVLLVKRTHEPFKGSYCLPGATVKAEETLIQAAEKALFRSTGWSEQVLRRVHLEQLAAFDGLYRDPRQRSISIAFLGLAYHLPHKPSVEGMFTWQSLSSFARRDLPFDHGDMVVQARQRLRGKIKYTNIAEKLLPSEFRIEILHRLYEYLLEVNLNLSNFRTKLLKMGMIEQVGIEGYGVRNARGGRRPHLYRFCEPTLTAWNRDFV